MGRIFPFPLKAGPLELSMETLIEDTPLINSWSFGMQAKKLWKRGRNVQYLACWLTFTFPTTSISLNKERNFDTHEALLSLSDTHSLITAFPVKMKMLIVY